jgi:hypothetical protein
MSSNSLAHETRQAGIFVGLHVFFRFCEDTAHRDDAFAFAFHLTLSEHPRPKSGFRAEMERAHVDVETEQKVASIGKLLKQATSLNIVGAFLRANGAPHHSCPDWETACETRLPKAIESESITVKGLEDFLADVEEHGHQHVFLYKATSKWVTTEVMSERNVVARLKKIGRLDALRAPNILVSPTEATITAVRYEESLLGDAIVVKVADESVYREEILPRKREGTREFREFELHPKRVVNVARLHSNGILEIRISQQTERTGTGPYLGKGEKSIADPSAIMQRHYERLIAEFRKHIAPVLPLDDFTSAGLSKCKESFWKYYESISNRIKFNDTIIDRDDDVRAKFTSKSGKRGVSVRDNISVVDSAAAFRAKGTSYLDTHNLHWLKREGEEVPSSDIHVKLAGMDNEFLLSVHCMRSDYEYVFGDITRHNR